MTSSCLGQISHIPNNSMPCTLTFFDNQENQRAKDRDQPHQRLIQPQDEMKSHLEMEGSSDHQQLISPNSINNCCNDYFTNHSLPFHNVREGIDQHESVKWMPSKMRIMRKLMNSDHNTTRKPRRRQHQPQEHKQPSQERSNENFHQGIVRVCSACKTTKTPLWRSGPCGPKSLCNACGIRQRKERRAMAAGAVDGGRLGVVAGKPVKGKAANVDCSVPFKKRCRFTTAERKLCFEDRVFPQDEKDAAILLMTLSCGLICN